MSETATQLEEIRAHFKRHDQHVEAIEQRFDSIDGRFDAIYRRFEAVEGSIRGLGLQIGR